MISGKEILSSHAIIAAQFDGKGGWVDINESSIATPEQPFWLHLNYENNESSEWLENSNLIPDYIREALGGDSSRPRMTRLGDGVFIALRSINHQNEDLPDPLVSLRIYMTDSLVISTRCRMIYAVSHIKKEVETSNGPISTCDWLIDVADAITDQAGDFIDGINGLIIDLEDNISEKNNADRLALPKIRKQLVLLRRYLFPQRDVFSKLANDKINWFKEDDRRRLIDIADRLGREVEDLDAAIARTTILSDEISAMLADEMNRKTYLISILAAVFLPASLLTGLFGVNLAGIPGTSSPWAFSVFCIFLVMVGGAFSLILKRTKLI